MNVLLEKLHVRYGVSPYFKISVEPHPLNPNENGIRIGPGGLGLPNKEYYYTDDDKIVFELMVLLGKTNYINLISVSNCISKSNT